MTSAGPTTAGVQPRSTEILDGFGPTAESFANESGHPIVSSNKTYAIYWDPTDQYHGDWQHLIATFLQRVGSGSGSTASVFAVDSQYTDAANQHASYKSTYTAAYTDTTPYPLAGCTDPNPLEAPDQITCLSDAQVRTELESFVSQHGLTKGMGSIFYVLTPPGVTVCLDAGGSPKGHCSDYSGLPGKESYENSFCSYHADISPTSPTTGDANTILYAVVPWTAGGLADGHLTLADQTAADDCQDGGFDPSSNPAEKKEKAKEKNKKETEEFGEATKEEKEKIELKEKLEGPHQEEPNQVPCPSPDGSCDTGLADLIVNQIAVEQQNVVTDPLLNAWQDPAGNEATDECRDFFAGGINGSVTASEETGAGTLSNQSLPGGNYYLNDAFNLAALKLAYPGVPCLTGINLVPQFTAPSPVNSGELVGFDGMESDISLDAGTAYSAGKPKQAYARFTWNFGDGTPTVSGVAPGATPNSPGEAPCALPWESPCAASEFHSYQYGGTYEVTLTVTDTGGNSASFTEPITVNGPPRPVPVEPGPGGPGAGSGSGAASAGGGSGSNSNAPGAGGAAGPLATQAVVSHSLGQSLRHGLVVRYSVSQRATGHFEVLLAASVAHHIGLRGPSATGLPTGTPPQVVVARGLLVATKGGRGTTKIAFSKATAKRLHRLHKVSLLLRLVVRNGAGGTTSVLSRFPLSG